MGQLHQVLAVLAGRKKWAITLATERYQTLQKAGLTAGFVKTYKPLDEEGEKKPDEAKNPQINAMSFLYEAVAALTEFFDLTAEQDLGNCSAKADVVVGEQTLLKDVPVQHLIFFEQQLVHIRTVIDALPVLDPAEEWAFDTASNMYRAKPAETISTKKVKKVLLKAEATEKHPAQTEVYDEDVPVGKYTTIKFSTAVPAKTKDEMQTRLRLLLDAVRAARTIANQIETKPIKQSSTLFDYVLKG